ncbi:MAG: Na+/H+ antiporter subunit E [Methanoregulaceae archaeon]|jgi:multicomponent Na+:H+ antiporter subunit E|nr:Na+/H+ antiporter subunit E [Methanoregulaceae archaeon]MCU0628268.1 Na+/H+ antiporter subunit E [Methanoregulaceae archaeon]
MHTPRPARGDPVIAFFLTFFLSLFVYLILTAGSGNVGFWSVSELTAGVALSLMTAAIARKFLCRAGNYRMANPLRFLLIPVYVIGPFFLEVIKANLDVAYRVITMRIRPGIIRVSSDLKSDLGIFMLANSITLTPGTITVDIDEKTHDLYIHNINVGAGDEDKPVIPDYELFSISDLPKWIRRIAE